MNSFKKESVFIFYQKWGKGRDISPFAIYFITPFGANIANVKNVDNHLKLIINDYTLVDFDGFH